MIQIDIFCITIICNKTNNSLDSVSSYSGLKQTMKCTSLCGSHVWLLLSVKQIGTDVTQIGTYLSDGPQK